MAVRFDEEMTISAGSATSAHATKAQAQLSSSTISTTSTLATSAISTSSTSSAPSATSTPLPPAINAYRQDLAASALPPLDPNKTGTATGAGGMPIKPLMGWQHDKAPELDLPKEVMELIYRQVCMGMCMHRHGHA